MKKNLLAIAYCLMVCAFLSCKKENAAAPAEQAATSLSSVDKGLISEVVSLNSYAERKAAYTNILNSYERYTVWTERNQAIINSGVLNKEQSTLFKQAAAKLSVAIFTSKTERFGLTAFFDDWKVKALQVFSDAQLKYLISDVAKFNKDTYIQIGVAEQSSIALKYKINGKVCGCSLQSDWCNSQGDCMPVSDCTANGYCGTFLVYECNGMCSKVIIEEQEP